MSDATDSPDAAGDDIPRSLVVQPEQVFNGCSLAPGGKTSCTACQSLLREGDPVGFYAIRPEQSTAWDIVRVHCWSCAPGGRAHPIRGADEVVGRARLAVVADPATESSRLILTDVGISLVSPPDAAEKQEEGPSAGGRR